MLYAPVVAYNIGSKCGSWIQIKFGGYRSRLGTRINDPTRNTPLNPYNRNDFCNFKNINNILYRYVLTHFSRLMIYSYRNYIYTYHIMINRNR